MSSALMKSGVLSHDRPSSPLKVTCFAPAHAGLFEHVFERHAAPARVAHRAVAHLAAGDARIEEPAAVAGALVDRDVFDGSNFF